MKAAASLIQLSVPNRAKKERKKGIKPSHGRFPALNHTSIPENKEKEKKEKRFSALKRFQRLWALTSDLSLTFHASTLRYLQALAKAVGHERGVLVEIGN